MIEPGSDASDSPPRARQGGRIIDPIDRSYFRADLLPVIDVQSGIKYPLYLKQRMATYCDAPAEIFRDDCSY
jgi:hypothetical protein